MSVFKQYYNQDKDKYGINSNRRKKILDLIGPTDHKKILDLGCSTGYLGKSLKKDNNQVVGIDISEKAAQEAQKELDQVFVCDLQEEELPLAEKSFDIVVLAEVIEHLLFPERAIEKAKKVLKDDGVIIITTPNFLVLSNRLKMLLGKFQYAEDGFLDRGHVHFFTYKELKRFLANNNLKVLEENNITYFRVPDFLSKIWPNLFVFQVIIKATLDSKR